MNHGLELVSFIAAASFHGSYEKRSATAPPRTLTLEQARIDLFGRYYQATLRAPAALSGPVAPGATVDVPITVQNRSQAGWCVDSQIPVFLSYHLRSGARGSEGAAAGTMIAFDNARSPLPGHLQPGTDTIVPLAVTAPAEAGDYVLEIDLVHEGITWFADRGARTATVALTVVGPDGA